MKKQCGTCENYCPYSISEGTCKVFGGVDSKGFVEFAEYGDLHVKRWGVCKDWKHHLIKLCWNKVIGLSWDSDYIYLTFIKIRRRVKC